MPAADGQPASAGQVRARGRGQPTDADGLAGRRASPGRAPDDVVPIQMEGDGPLVVREKFHKATPMSIDQALLEMELVGHDFYLFRDDACGHPSVVYRRHGYQYGLIRLIEVGGRRRGTAAQREGVNTAHPARYLTCLTVRPCGRGGTRPQAGLAWRGPVGQSLIQGRRNGAVPGSARPDAPGAGPAAG